MEVENKRRRTQKGTKDLEIPFSSNIPSDEDDDIPSNASMEPVDSNNSHSRCMKIEAGKRFVCDSMKMLVLKKIDFLTCLCSVMLCFLFYHVGFLLLRSLPKNRIHIAIISYSHLKGFFKNPFCLVGYLGRF